ncbi:MAG: hypothetical protein PF961_17215 [Planctomycetota bacterium]|jgi:lipoate-protein ligase A|nr:hypothetical protein [Planctomycetota bacterium]
MIRILSPLLADGPQQMALDEALLEAATVTTLRLYRWDPPTVSLGYFQDYHSIAAALPEPIALVRRITGGGAIWHDHELTYAIVGQLGRDGLPARTRDCYAPLHAAVAAAVISAGGQAERQSHTVGDRRYRDEPRCFASPAAEDLIAPRGGKILGSAARTRGDRILIHGSLKLASNPWDQDVVAPCGLEADAAAAALKAGLLEALGQSAEAGTCTETELAAAARIQAERYSNDDWVVHRRGPRA